MIKIFNDILKKEQILVNESMKKHTTFKIGGNANLVLLPHSKDEILKSIEVCKKNNINYYIIGNGSNILATDKGYNGVIIKIASNFNNIYIDGDEIIAQSGATLAKISKIAKDNSLKGCEFMCSIPGTIGGGVCMNAGAYGGELKNIIKSVTVIEDDKICILSNEECEFEYRNSKILRQKFVVLEVHIHLEKGDKNEIEANMKANIKKRNDKQPTNKPSAGSIFKRPKDNFAGKLIMEAGFAGFRVGDALVSEKHCGFIVNDGYASSFDVLKLMDIVKKEVKDKFNIELENEVRILGEI